jgi:RNA polymerase sigma-70 factor (ECF subfamily)
MAYDRHANLVFGSVARFVGDREAASEVVQDTFLALWRRAEQFDPRAGSLAGWLLGIARHRSIDRLRSEARRPSRGAITLDALPWGDADGASGQTAAPELVADREAEPDAMTDRRWAQSVVRTYVSELSEEERRVLGLAYAAGLSQSEISSHLGWPLGTVKSRTRRALAHLRSRLAAEPGLIDVLLEAPDTWSGAEERA